MEIISQTYNNISATMGECAICLMDSIYMDGLCIDCYAMETVGYYTPVAEQADVTQMSAFEVDVAISGRHTTDDMTCSIGDISINALKRMAFQKMLMLGDSVTWTHWQLEGWNIVTGPTDVVDISTIPPEIKEMVCLDAIIPAIIEMGEFVTFNLQLEYIFKCGFTATCTPSVRPVFVNEFDWKCESDWKNACGALAC